MTEPSQALQKLSDADFEAYRDGRYQEMTDEGFSIIQALPRRPSVPIPSMSLGPSMPLEPPSGGSITPEQIGTFAAEEGPVVAGQMLGAAAGAMTGPMSPVAIPFLSGVGALGGKYVGNAMLGRGLPSPAEQAATFGTGLVTEAGGQALTRGLPFMLRSTLGAPTASQSPATAEALRIAEKRNIVLSGGQTTGSPGVSVGEQLPARYALGVSGPVEFGERQRAAAAANVLDLQRNLGRTPGMESTGATGRAIGEAVEQAQVAAKGRMDALYAEARKSAGGITIHPTNRLRMAEAYLADEGLVAKGVQDRPGLRVAGAAREGRALTPDEQAQRDVLETRLAEIRASDADIQARPEGVRAAIRNQLPDMDAEVRGLLSELAESRPMTFRQTEELEKRVTGAINKADRSGDTYRKKRLIEIRDGIRQDFDETAQAVGGDFAQKLTAARKNAAEEYFPDFKDKQFPMVLRQAALDHPELVVGKLLDSDSVGIQQMHRVLKQSGPTWQRIQSQVIQDMATASQASLEEAGGQVGQRFSVAKWLALTEGPTSRYRMDRLKEVLDPDTVGSIQELNRLFRVIQNSSSTFYGANPSGTAGALLAVGQIYAIYRGLSGGVEAMASGDQKEAVGSFGAAAFAASAPAILSKMILSKGSRDIIARGVTQAHGWAAKSARMLGGATRGAARMATDPLADAVTVPPMNPTP